LVPIFVGSNPSVPEKKRIFFVLGFLPGLRCTPWAASLFFALQKKALRFGLCPFFCFAKKSEAAPICSAQRRQKGHKQSLGQGHKQSHGETLCLLTLVDEFVSRKN
jgi:hypothetical protein